MTDHGLQRDFVHGVAWSGLARWTAQLITWLATIAVARLLTPADYGLVAMATVGFGAISVLAEFGIATTVVTFRTLTRSQLAQLNGLATLLGVGGFAVAAAAAPLVASWVDRPEVAGVLPALAASFLLIGPRQVPIALLQRDRRFREFAAIEALQAVATAATTVTAATFGAGFWALVIGPTVGHAAATLAVLARVTCPVVWPRIAGLPSDALRFTRHVLTGNAAWYVHANADFAVVGGLLGAASLGVYTLAWTLARVVPERLAHLVTRVTPAFFATLRDNPRTLCTWVYALTEILSVVTFPLLAGLVLTAPDAVPLLLGPQWSAAVFPLQILALYGMWDVLVQLISRSLTAVGEARFMARIGLSLVLAMPLAFIVGSGWGIEGVAIAWVLVNPAVRLRIILEARRCLGLSLRRWAVAIWPAASSTMLMAAAVWAVGRYATGQPPLERLVAQIVTGALVFAGALLIFHRPRVRTWQSAIGRLRAADGIARGDAEAAA